MLFKGIFKPIIFIIATLSRINFVFLHHDSENLKDQRSGRLLSHSRILNDQGDDCSHVCVDLPDDDTESVCMMFSRYKKGYQYFVNQCHARRTICKGNLLLHMVHPSRCLRTNTFFMPVS